MVKAKFFFPETILTPLKEDHPRFKERNLVEGSIIKKTEDKIINLPCVPSKEMKVDLGSFHKQFEFNRMELEYVNDEVSFFIREIYIQSDCIELWLDNI